MSTVDALLRPLARLLNRNIAESTPARELCEALAGSLVAVRVADTAMTTWMHIEESGLTLSSDSDREPDVVISGSPLALMRLARDSEGAIRDGDVDLSGDASKAQQVQRLLQFAKPDFEEQLSSVVGDVAAHRLGEFARGARRWSQEAGESLRANVREYLQEERRDVPTRSELQRFADDVGQLRDAVDRAEARLKHLQATD